MAFVLEYALNIKNCPKAPNKPTVASQIHSIKPGVFHTFNDDERS